MGLDRMSLLPGQTVPMLERLLRLDDSGNRSFHGGCLHLFPESRRDFDVLDWSCAVRHGVDNINLVAPWVKCSLSQIGLRARRHLSLLPLVEQLSFPSETVDQVLLHH